MTPSIIWLSPGHKIGSLSLVVISHSGLTGTPLVVTARIQSYGSEDFACPNSLNRTLMT